MSDSRNDGYSMVDLLATVLRRKWIIIGLTGGVGVVVFTFLMLTSRLPLDSRWNFYPDYFQPTVKVLIQESNSSSGLSGLLQSSGLGGLAGLAGLGGTSTRTNADLAQALIVTTPVLDPVVEEFKIVEREKITRDPRTKSRKAIADGLSMRFTPTSGILSIGYRNTDREFATKIVTRLVQELQNQFQRINLDQVTNQRQLFEQMLVEQAAVADRSSQALIRFQTVHGVLDVTTQLNETARSLTELQSQLTTKQLELKVMQKYYPESDARIIQRKGEIEELQRLMEAIRKGSGDFSTGGVAQADLPEQQQLLATLLQQIELSRLEEKNVARLFQIVEPAEVPEVKAGPPRTMLLVVSTFAAGVVSILIAFLVDFFKREPSDPREAASFAALRDAARIRRIRRSPKRRPST
jgi:tyrosine-protein kinase Etk/Wzc